MNKQTEALKLALDYIVATNKSSEFWLIPASNLNKTVTAIKEALAQPEQEPVAWLHTKIEGVAVPHRPADLDKHPDRWEALYKTPPPCPTCEALARTVMLDQTSYDTTPPQRKPLTDEQIWDEVKAADLDWQTGWSLDEDASNRYITFARAIEAAHGIKENA